jgi:transcriptional regulator of acetoin/glycerol metabolism
MIRAAVLANGPEITPEDLPAEIVQGTFSADLSRLSTLGDVERAAILGALEATSGHQVRAAARLGISRRTLQRRIKSYGLASERNLSGTSDERASTRW